MDNNTLNFLMLLGVMIIAFLVGWLIGELDDKKERERDKLEKKIKCLDYSH